MYLLDDIITYMRRILKTPSNSSITDSLLIDYINRFWINDVDVSLQLFDLKKQYSFQTTPGVDRYNMPLYSTQVENPDINGNPNPNSQLIHSYPVYQGFLGPCYVNGIECPLYTQKQHFFNVWPNVVQNFVAVERGDGGNNYKIQVPILPNSIPPNPPYNALLRGHVDITGILATGSTQDPPLGLTFKTTIPVTSVQPAVYITTIGSNGGNVVVTDSGQFFSFNQNLGLLMNPGNPPLGNSAATNGYTNVFNITAITLGVTTTITVNNTIDAGQQVQINSVLGTTQLNGNFYTVLSATATSIVIDVNSTIFTAYVSGGTVTSFQNFVNYLTGEIDVTFPTNIPEGNNINVQVYYFQGGLPRGILYYDNTITLRNVPAQQYLVELQAYLSPAAYLNSADAITFGYMSEYIARGAARKILSDTGDVEQLNFYEPLFKEQESLVWKRSLRQWTSTRTQTIYSQGMGAGGMGNSNMTGGAI